MRLAVLASLFVLGACGVDSSHKKLAIEGEGEKSVLIAGVSADVKAQAERLGLQVEGDTILRVQGDVDLINQLNVDPDASAVLDEALLTSEREPFKIEPGSQYLAKKDFGLLEFWKKKPEADGRGVVVGVFDDGISAHQSGFRVTSTGARKLLKRGSYSTLTTYTLTKNAEGVFEGEVDETRQGFGGTVDVNADGKKAKFKASFINEKVCLDINSDASLDASECKGIFSESGDYFLLANNTSILAEFNRETGALKISQPEDDSHGEGVAAVMAAFNQANLGMSGVAPGAQMVDFDISEAAMIPSEAQYTMGSILLGLEWLAKNGAEVANISYSLFFSSVQAQDFMAQAIDQLVKKYNIVLSFSAGNNGPGLGSLNRRVIYPESTIVAGAFVSQELDERVWGVTGLPAEGRVIYYSSRGPGPLGDGGPNMLGPLSSLTHSTPDAGFRAFNGTSSAAPSLAGAAAVLISAIKQEGLKVDAYTVVQAMKLSGKRLELEPYVFQGHGLPQIEKALEIYKRMSTGEMFAQIGVRANRGTQDRVGGRGLLFFKSRSNSVESARLDLTGFLSPLAARSVRVEALVPLKLEYSKGLSGSKELWASVSGSRVHVDVDISEVLEGSSGEAFGEILIRDQRTDELLAIVPVTVIDDKPATRLSRQVFTVGPQGSARMHVNAPLGVKALKVKFRGISGPFNMLNFSSFDSHRARTQQIAFIDEMFIPVERAGHHQVGLAMVGGAGAEATVEVEVEGVSFDLTQSAIASAATAATVGVSYTGASTTYAKLSMTPVGERVGSTITTSNQEVKPLEIEMNITQAGTYTANIRPTMSADTRLFYTNCSHKTVDAAGVETHRTGATFTKTGEDAQKVTFSCLPFDQGMNNGHSEAWMMEVLRSKGAAETRDVIFTPNSTRATGFSKKSPGTYEIRLAPMNGAQSISLGLIDVF
jgi:subtilisin family serine protease